MRQLGNMKFLVIFSTLFLINGSYGLNCWRCSSDAANWCGQTIERNHTSKNNIKYNYVQCDAKPASNVLQTIDNLIPKCQLLIQTVYDVKTYTRSCYWEQANVPSDACKNQTIPASFVKIIDCKTCVEDGCNDRLITESEQKDNPITTDNVPDTNNVPVTNNVPDTNNNDVPDPNSSAVVAVMSHTVLCVMLMLSMVIGY